AAAHPVAIKLIVCPVTCRSIEDAIGTEGHSGPRRGAIRVLEVIEGVEDPTRVCMPKLEDRAATVWDVCGVSALTAHVSASRRGSIDVASSIQCHPSPGIGSVLSASKVV